MGKDLSGIYSSRDLEKKPKQKKQLPLWWKKCVEMIQRKIWKYLKVWRIYIWAFNILTFWSGQVSIRGGCESGSAALVLCWCIGFWAPPGVQHYPASCGDVCGQFLEDKGIDTTNKPPCSLDLNPTEFLWDFMFMSIQHHQIAPQTVHNLSDILV